MGDSTGIQWTDATWNVMTGCTPISPGCDHCYAKTLAETRMRPVYLRQLPVLDNAVGRADPFAPRWWPERLEQPLRWKRPRRIFVNSMSDVFHAHFTYEHIAAVFDVMKRADWHQFQVLTKRPERALRYADRLPWPGNVWLGVSIERMEYAHRADVLRQLSPAVRFVSAEPLLGSLARLNLSGIDWIIPGGESGAGARVDGVERWIGEIIPRAREFGTKVFVKQLGGVSDKRGEPDAWPEGLRVREYPDTSYTLI